MQESIGHFVGIAFTSRKNPEALEGFWLVNEVLPKAKMTFMRAKKGPFFWFVFFGPTKKMNKGQSMFTGLRSLTVAARIYRSALYFLVLVVKRAIAQSQFIIC
ncbi:MAG: hypothetical protein CFE24_08385 [Flavobacterium sp. BFFFF2]|nr:MAG: hypothetical protein CFE24_08385 [Flavobacterium sp. BFFFF2]